MAVFYTESITVTGDSTYPDDPQVTVSFVPEQLIFQNRGDGAVFISFDGDTDAVELWTGESVTLTPKSAWLYRTIYVREAVADVADSGICRVSLFG